MIDHIKMIVMVILVSLFGLMAMRQHSLIQPAPQPPLVKENRLRAAAVKLGLPDPGEEVIKAIEFVAERPLVKAAGLNKEFLLSLAYSECAFNIYAVSSKGFNGLFQIRPKVFHPVANTLIGIEGEEEGYLKKLQLANGDHRQAIVLYKGFRDDPKRGRIFADRVLVMTRQLKEI